MIKVIDMTVDGKCSNCGACCTSFLPLTKHEYRRIVAYLKDNPDITEERHLENGSLHVLCPFRDEVNKRCKIYEVRPFVCRNFICNKPSSVLEHDKDGYLNRAYYNSREFSSFISGQRLFFDDISWEYNLWYNQTNCNSVADFKRNILKLKPHNYEELLAYASTKELKK